MYIKRNIQNTIEKITKNFKVLLVTGAQGVGKTTLLKHCVNDIERTYVSLGDLMARNLALTDPALFLQRYNPPVLIDEIQYAPQLLNYIKNYVDHNDINGNIWLTSSIRIPVLDDVNRIFGDLVGIIDLQGLSLNEVNQTKDLGFFVPSYNSLTLRAKTTIRYSLKEIYKIIWQGCMPAIYNNSDVEWRAFYASYVQTLIHQDVMKILQINDEMVFFKFFCAAAAQTGRIVNYAELAKAAEISAPTAKQWVKTLEAIGIIYMLQPFNPPGSKYVVRAPKLYFCDTGLAAYLTSWNNPEALETGAMSNEFFATWVVMEIYKSYTNNGLVPPLYYLRNFNGKELDLIIYENGIAYPVAISKSTLPNKMLKTFAILTPVANDAQIKIGEGAIICFADGLIKASENISYVPAWMI